MGVRNATSGNNVVVTANPANGVDTIVAQTGLVGLVQDNAQVIILWMVTFTTGVGATGITLRIRRGIAAASTVINAGFAPAVAASAIGQFSASYTDTPGILGQVQYSLWVTIAGGAASVAINDVSIAALVL